MNFSSARVTFGKSMNNCTYLSFISVQHLIPRIHSGSRSTIPPYTIHNAKICIAYYCQREKVLHNAQIETVQFAHINTTEVAEAAKAVRFDDSSCCVVCDSEDDGQWHGRTSAEHPDKGHHDFGDAARASGLQRMDNGEVTVNGNYR